MSIRILEGWTDEEWDDEVRRHPEATIYHSRLWSRICCASFPHLRDRSLWVEITNGAGTSRHLLPLQEWRRGRGLFRTLHSAFPFIYGGPLPLHGAGGESVLPEVLALLAKSPGTIRISANPLAGASAPPPPAPGWNLDPMHTHLRSLPETDTEFWDDELPPRRRNDVRRLTKKGVSVEESRSAEDVSRVYALYVASFERWGGTPTFVHPEGFYQNLVRMGGDAVRLSVARHEEKVIGGVFALRFGVSVQYFAGYFDANAKSLRPNVLLQVDSIRRAIGDGFRFYDFLPSGGNESVEQFKEGYGGVRTEFPVWNRRSLAHRLLARARRP